MSEQLQQQEVQWCRQVAASGSVSCVAEKLYVDMMLSREEEEGSAALSPADQAALNRSLTSGPLSRYLLPISQSI